MNKLISRKIKKAQFGVQLKANPTEKDFNIRKVNNFMHKAHEQDKYASDYASEILGSPDQYKPGLVRKAKHYTNFANLPEEQFNSGDPEGDAMYNRLLNGSTITGSSNTTYGTDGQTNDYHYLQTTEQGDSIWSGNSNGTNYHIYKNGVTGQYGYELSNGDAQTKINLEQIPENVRGFMVSPKSQVTSHKQGAKLIKKFS